MKLLWFGALIIVIIVLAVFNYLFVAPDIMPLV
jgi:hypothetical protein